MVIKSKFSGHTLYINEISADDFPAFDNKDGYAKFYEVRNFDAKGVIFMYLGKGHRHARREIVAWYSKGAFWDGYGVTFGGAIEGAQRDGWLYA